MSLPEGAICIDINIYIAPSVSVIFMHMHKFKYIYSGCNIYKYTSILRCRQRVQFIQICINISIYAEGAIYYVFQYIAATNAYTFSVTSKVF